ncbi:MAG: hypothetical protein R2745_00670 [Vicinamibacterales bacterium]
MGPLSDLLAVDHRRTLEFFFVGLKDVSEASVDRQELLYNASVLAHYAQVSTAADAEFPTPAALGSVFDHFVADTTSAADPRLMETAGTHCLLMAGFFEDQMRHRYNVAWYARLGAGFFHRAARLEPSTKRAMLLNTMSREFEPWRGRYARLSRELRATPFLLDLPVPPRTM